VVSKRKRSEKDKREGKRRRETQAAILENERESATSHCMEISLWKKLWTCRKTDYGMNGTLKLNVGFT
jgi:hypothetical protein